GGSDSGVPTTSDKGSICVPPRRRRLYVGKLQEWAKSDETTKSPQPVTVTQPQVEDAASTSSQNATHLRDAFIKSAAIETFFAWHRYKKEKEKKKPQGEAGALALPQVLESEDEEEKPQSKLETGDIPEEFKRQMFYTLGDYRDILVGDQTAIGALSEEDKEAMKKIQEKIKDIVEKPNGVTPPTPPGHKSENPRKTWWDTNAQHIWKGMVCALTYTDDTNGGPPKQNDTLKSALLDNNNKPKNGNDHDYTYENVVLKEEDTGTEGPKASTASQHPTTTKLSDFVKIPTFFRWLHEWGNSFCFERAKRLAQIKHECKVEENGDRRRGG
ncbi:hypothetical protein PFTANZ_06193, partial [Plasmodium falciparum Tanzania (2000708)]